MNQAERIRRREQIRRRHPLLSMQIRTQAEQMRRSKAEQMRARRARIAHMRKLEEPAAKKWIWIAVAGVGIAIWLLWR